MNTFKQNYKLPHSSQALDPLIQLAEKTHQQAEAADSYLVTAIQSSESTVSELLPKLPSAKSLYADSISGQYKSLNNAIESAIDAHKSEFAILVNGEKVCSDLLQRQTARTQTLSTELTGLQQRTEALRDYLAGASKAPQTEITEKYAKELQDDQRLIYQKYLQLNNCRRLCTENEDNIVFLRQLQKKEEQALANLDRLKEQVNNKAKQVNAYLNTEPAANEVNAISRDASTDEATTDIRDNKDAKTEKHPVLKTIWSYIKVILIAVLLAFVLRAYVFGVTQVKGTSMCSTLDTANMLITSKISYLIGDPDRGDIVVLDAPDSVGEDYIKRVIAMPNEQIDISGGMVYINGELLDEPYIQGAYTEGDIHMIVPDGYYFVMGDNREVSRDSRVDNIGPISKDAIHGKAIFRYWPIKDFGTLK